MGWKGTIRSMAAAARAAERDAERRRKQKAKQQMAADTEDAVVEWEDYLDDLVSVGESAAQVINWAEIAAIPKPEPPQKLDEFEKKAAQRLNSFKPSFWHFLRGGSEKLQKTYEDDLVAAAKKDEEVFQKARSEYPALLKEWEEETEIARKIVEGDSGAIRDVISEFQTLSQDDHIGSAIRFSIIDGVVHAKPLVHGTEIVPSVRKKQLASGRLSETKMPIGQFNELYQDYVCSVAFRVANDLFAILPADELFVTCYAEMLNTKTGHQEETPIVSVQFVRPTFERLNLDMIDPSDALQNFNHQQSFKKTKGFGPVDPLGPIEEAED